MPNKMGVLNEKRCKKVEPNYLYQPFKKVEPNYLYIKINIKTIFIFML